jgi:hypothetical protein
MPAPFSNFLPIFLLLVFLLSSSTPAAPKEDSAPPPSPSVGNVIGSPSVVRGGVCEVVVRGIVMPMDSAEFKIHKGPKHGSLEGPRVLGRDSAVFIYRHDGKKGADSDRIDFKLKTGPNNTWGRFRAEIAIEEPPSRIELVDDRLDFGSVPIGQTRSAFLQVRNGGGGILRTEIEAAPPWSIEGPVEFDLAEGESRDIRVVFSPGASGEFQGRLEVVAGADRRPVVLKGEGIFRFGAPERVAFGVDAIGQELKIPLTNLTSDELPLVIDIPKPLLGDASLVLPPSGTASVRLRVEKRHYTEKFVDLKIADGSAARALRVTLPPPPALLEWAAAGGTVDLGEVAPRHIPRPEFELRNRGATPAIVGIHEGGGGLELERGQASRFHLEPGETAVVKTVWRLPENPGELSASLVASHGGLEHPLTVRAVLAAPPVTEEEKEPPPASMEPTPPPLQVLGGQERQELARRLPQKIGYRLTPAGRVADAVVTWKYGGPEPVLFSIEKKTVEQTRADLGEAFERRLKVPGELPRSETAIKWSPSGNSVQRLEGGVWQGVVTGLAPGFHELRIATRTPPDGPRIDHSSFAVRVPPLPPNPLWKWLAGSLGIFCLLYLLRKKFRRWFGLPPEN